MENIEPPVKKQKTVEEEKDPKPIISDFSGFKIEKVLAENSRCKTVTVHAKVGENDAVVLLEKTPFDKTHLDRFVNDQTSLNNTLKNDIYGTYEAFPPPTENALKAVVICPATDKHIQKYTYQERFVIRETAELYKTITLPLLEKKQFSIQWVYNILEKKQEADRIVYEDPDPESGFILLPDMKWDRKDVSSLYLVAIVHRHNIKSLRDLNTDSLPLLKNIQEKGLAAIMDTYGVPSSKLHVYVHYQPSYYHFHVHFTNIEMEAPGFGAERAHLLSDVIDNIEMDGDYYGKKTLTFCVRKQEDLYKEYKEAKYFAETKCEN